MVEELRVGEIGPEQVAVCSRVHFSCRQCGPLQLAAQYIYCTASMHINLCTL